MSEQIRNEEQTLPQKIQKFALRAGGLGVALAMIGGIFRSHELLLTGGAIMTLGGTAFIAAETSKPEDNSNELETDYDI